MKRRLLVEIICILFVVLFVYAATSKLNDYQKFKVQLGQSPMFTAFAGWVVWLVPGIEIIISIMLATKKFRLPGLYASFSLMVMFTSYIFVITRYSDYVPCSCGGVLEKMNWGEHLIFNISFVVLGTAGILLYTPQPMKVGIVKENKIAQA